MAGQPAWSSERGGGAFPSTLTTKLDVDIPSKYFGKKVKIAFQFQTDDAGFAGYGTGFALDSYILWVY
jgi:protein involved in sex pheromone biosynthesis